MENTHIGAGEATWDLEFMYRDIDDPQIGKDIDEVEFKAKRFQNMYQGKLAEKLGGAIEEYSRIKVLGDKALIYLFLMQSLDVADPRVKAKVSEAEQRVNFIYGNYLTFFILELVALDEAIIEKLCVKNTIVKTHKPWITHQRIFKPHLLDGAVESALTKRASFGSNAWSEFFDECEADISIPYQGKEKTLTEMLDIIGNSHDRNERAEASRLINGALGGYFAKYSAQALYVVVGEAAVERRERSYQHPMQPQNKSNRVPDAVVDALHRAVMGKGAELARRYYRLKAKMLDLPALAWSDRNAPLPFADTSLIPYKEGIDIVRKAYQSFSPTLADIVQKFIEKRHIDAPATKGKRGGAFNCSWIMPDGRPESLTLLNYLGSTRDVMTLAHELGHGVHGILAGKAQGPLMFHAPIAYCETASVFGEMTTFHFLEKQLRAQHDDKARLALLTRKIEDMINTVVRQIGFSNFERRIHGMNETYAQWSEPKKLSVAELDAIWLATAQELYGREGDIFTYQDTEHLWAYISHFHRPFYVYGYAFGELLTQSIYAQQARFGSAFETLYLELLRAGATKDATELMAPFGLNPSSETFWEEGLNAGLANLIKEAESIYEGFSTGEKK